MSEKLQKVLARAGLGSRRALEQKILEGRVSVNGQVATLGLRVSLKDVVKVDGALVNLSVEAMTNRRVLVYNKPEGEVCTRSDPEGRSTVFERLPTLAGERWIAIGRLDINTSGLLLFTTDGELANRLMHPSTQIEREYAVRIQGQPSDAALANLLNGVLLDDGMAKFDQISAHGGTGVNQWFHVQLCEGRNREVRRLWESQGLQVSRLKRIRYGTVRLPPRLKTGQYLELEAKDINSLARLAGLKGKPVPAPLLSEKTDAKPTRYQSGYKAQDKEKKAIITGEERKKSHKTSSARSTEAPRAPAKTTRRRAGQSVKKDQTPRSRRRTP